MNIDDGSIRLLLQDKKPKPNEVLINVPRPDCERCKGKGSIPLAEGTRPERRRAQKRGLPVWSKFMPCPECNPD